jgi:hypothetical protein
MEQTLGQKRVGYNPHDKDGPLKEIKRNASEIIDRLEENRIIDPCQPISEERSRIIDIAQTQIELGCMAAVRSFFTD